MFLSVQTYIVFSAAGGTADLKMGVGTSRFGDADDRSAIDEGENLRSEVDEDEAETRRARRERRSWQQRGVERVHVQLQSIPKLRKLVRLFD
jgi:hypothetical protein